jgi:hypothetical protein
MRHSLAVLVVVAVLQWTPHAYAQGGGALQGAPPDLAPGEIQRLFDGMLVAEAQDALSLSERQYPDFLSRLRTLQETRRRNLVARLQLMADLQRLTNPKSPVKGDDATIRERLAALQELESRSAAELRKAYNAIDEVLDPRQQARFRLFEDQLERRKLELLLRARQNRQLQRRPGLR